MRNFFQCAGGREKILRSDKLCGRVSVAQQTPMMRNFRFTDSLFTYRYFPYGVAATADRVCDSISP